MASAVACLIAAKTADAYSYGRYNSWANVCEMLLERGYDEQEVEAIVRSKWTRWASDNSDAEYGEATAHDLARFMDDPRNQCTPKAVAELVAQTF